MENKSEYNNINPWAYDYNGYDEGGGIVIPESQGEGVDETELHNAIDTAVDKLVNGAPVALDTLGEIADELLGEEGVVSNLTSQINQKLDAETYETEKENFALKSEMPTKVSELENDSEFVTEEALDGFAKVDDVYTKTDADDKFATKESVAEVEANIPTKTSQIENDSDFTTNESVDEKIAEAVNGVATEEWVNEQGFAKVDELANVATSGSYNDLSDTPEIPVVPTVVSAFTNDAGYLTEHQDLSDYVKKEELANVATSGSYNDLSDTPEIPVVPTVVSAFTNDAGYLTEHQSLEDYVKKEELADVATSGSYNDLTDTPEIPVVPTVVSAFTNDAGYLTEHQDLSEYINGVVYDTDGKKIVFKHDDTVIAEIDATPFIKDGMVDSVVVEDGNLVITFNAESGKETITIPLSDIFNPENYYTKTEVDGLLDAKADDSSLATVAKSGDYADLENTPTVVSAFTNDAGYLTEHQSLEDYATKTEVNNAVEGVADEIPTKVSELDNDAGYLTEHQDLSDYVKKEELANVATSGSYNDLSDTPEIPVVPTVVSAFTNDAGYLTEHQPLEDYVKKEDLADVATSGSYNDLSDTPEIPVVPTVVSAFTNDAGYLTEHQSLADYVKKNELADVATSGSYNDLSDTPEIPVVPTVVSAFTNDAGYLTEHQDLSEYINGVVYDTDGKKIVFKHDDTVIAEIDATPFIKDGMVDSVVVEGGNLVITFNVESGKETISIPLTSIFNPENYYDKNAADDKFATKDEMSAADNEVLVNILSRIWSNTNTEVSGNFKTRYTNADGSYAQIWNESDGGGAIYENKTDNIKSFVGVNDGDRNNICAQIYSKDVDTNIGSRLNINPNGMFYAVGNSSEIVAANELAVKGDIANDRAEIDAIIAEKDATITKLNNDLYSLKKIVGDMGGAVTYDLPADGKTLNTLLQNNGTVKLSEDATQSRVGPGIMASNKTTLNLNGHTLVMDTTNNYGSILVRGTQEITVKGTGASRIENNGSGLIIWNASANSVVNLNGGTFYGNGDGSELIYCENGIINITGGTYRTTNVDKRYLLNCKDANYTAGTANIIVSSTSKTTGPKFYDFDPSNNPSEGEGTNYVAEGCHVISSVVVEDEVEYTVYTVVKDA